MANIQETLESLREVVDLTDDDIAAFEKERKRSRRFSSIPLKTSLDQVQVARFAINQYRYPGLEIKGYQRRYYPYGSALTHVIGYVAKINDKDVERLEKEGLYPNYAATRDIGKLGIERYYESVLHGKTGYEEVEVNSRGRVIRQLHEQPPQAGKDIYLTIDLELQTYIETLLTTSRAAVVVTDPRNGEILALVSNPSYDPNLFVGGISNTDYQGLLNNPDRPLINRATQGLYPPASTVKPFMSVAALSEGVITPNTTIHDPGWWQLPGSENAIVTGNVGVMENSMLLNPLLSQQIPSSIKLPMIWVLIVFPHGCPALAMVNTRGLTCLKSVMALCQPENGNNNDIKNLGIKGIPSLLV